MVHLRHGNPPVDGVVQEVAGHLLQMLALCCCFTHISFNCKLSDSRSAESMHLSHHIAHEWPQPLAQRVDEDAALLHLTHLEHRTRDELAPRLK